MSDKGPDFEIGVSSEGGKLALGSAENLARFLAPARYMRAEAVRVLLADAERKLSAGKSLDELPDLQRALLVAGGIDGLRKMGNRAAILELASKEEPKIAKVLELAEPGIKGLLPSPAPEPGEVRTEAPSVAFFDRFWADAEVVTDEYMQALYAKILAGEVRKPRSFSLKTLDVVRCLDVEPAQLFAKFMPLAIVDSKDQPFEGALPVFDEGADPNFMLWQRLDESGLISVSKATWTAKQEGNFFYHGGKAFQLPMHSVLHVRVMTQAGLELLSLAKQSEPDPEVIAWMKRRASGGGKQLLYADTSEGPFVPWPDDEPQK